jgi:DNA-binding XRE family transcriptional regulator
MNKIEYYNLRKELGTQEQAAKALDVDKGTISKRETGKYQITKEAKLALIGAVFLQRSRTETPFNKPPILDQY